MNAPTVPHMIAPQGPGVPDGSLAGRRVLLMAPRFFGYERDIRQEIERRGAHVDWLPDRPFDTPAMVALTRLRPQWILPRADRLYRRLLAEFAARDYDVMLIVNGQTLSHAMRMELQRQFPRATKLLYMWDSLENRPAMRDDLGWFDRAYTFDPSDAGALGMTLRPLFFGPGFARPPRPDHAYQLSFVGTAHTDRYAVIDRLRAGLPEGLRTYWYLYLQAAWVFYAYRLTNPAMRRARRGEFRFQPLPKADLNRVFAESLAVLDIEHPRQRGLTMRTFETLGAHKKLVTTNAQVRDYDFFDPENICVLDRRSPRVPDGFFDTPAVPPPQAVYRRYSLAGWADDVLGLAQERRP